MSEAKIAELTPDERPVVLRRAIARVIDDALLVTISTIVVLAVVRWIADEQVGEPGIYYGGEPFTTYAPLEDASHWATAGPDGLGSVALALGALLAAAAFLAYSWWGSRREGRTLGRMATGLAVRAADGTAAKPRVLLGRDVIRVALICVALALLSTAAQPINSVLDAFVAPTFSNESRALGAVLGASLPAAVVTALLVGFALIDPQQRAPHDRLAKTIVTRR